MNYFYVITIQWVSAGLNRQSTTLNGIHQASLGESRLDIYREVHAKACEQVGSNPGETITLFYYMEANKI